MNVTATVDSPTRASPALRYILLGGFFAGLADWIYPTVKTVMAGKPWTQPWKGVAFGLLGQAAKDGGAEIVALGMALHFFIAIAGAAIFFFVVRQLKWLPRNWLLLAVIYGIGILLVMNYVILPLSAIGRGIYPLNELHIHAFWHILLHGVPVGYFVARGLKQAGA
jgi:hypothetical protein